MTVEDLEASLRRLEDRLDSLTASVAWSQQTLVKLLRLFAAQWLFSLKLAGVPLSPETAERLGKIIGLHPLNVSEVLSELERLLQASEGPPPPSDRPAN